MIQVGTQLRQIRQRRNQTLAEVGAATNLSISYLSKIERSLAEPRLDELNALSKHYDVAMSQFITEDEAAVAIDQSSFTKFMMQMNGKVDATMQDVLVRIDSMAEKPAQTVEDWMRYYYVVSTMIMSR